MKKVLSATKLSSPSKLVRSSSGDGAFLNGTTTESCQTEPVDENASEFRRQVSALQETIEKLQNACHAKDKAIRALARDKECLSTESNKQRRENLNLTEQLNDERNFYMKEKQRYCKEMNENKKHRRKYSSNGKDSDDGDSATNFENVRSENGKLKLALNHYMETNYNLCIRFLRMKNTKDYLKKRFERYRSEQSKIMTDLTAKLENSREEINTIVNEQFQYPLSASNKKYLEVVKRNSQLIHENLCLKLEVQQMITNIEKMESEKIRRDSRSQLQYIKKQKPKSNRKQNIKSTSDDAVAEKKPLRIFTEPATLEVKSESVQNIRPKLMQLEYAKSKTSTESYSTLESASNKLTTITESSVEDNKRYSSGDCKSRSCDSIRTQSAPEILETANFRLNAPTATPSQPKSVFKNT